MKKFGLRRQLAGRAWALLFGIAAMGWLMGNMTLVFLSLLALSAAPVVLSALYAGYGPIPAALGLLLGGGTVALLSGLLTGAAPRGLAVGLGYALTVGVPAGVAAVLTDRRKPYFMRMRWTVGAQLGMLVAAVAAAYLALDQNLVDAYAALLRQSLGVLDRQLSDVLLPYLGALGMLDSATLDAVQHGVLTAAQRAALYDAAVEANVRMMQLALPMMLIT
ncbi:MAG: hypothetical protein GX558_06285, partial [Clostridiales bacterium]|nr:hypothetical protein [Clostridiales bacterium]